MGDLPKRFPETYTNFHREEKKALKKKTFGFYTPEN